MKFTWFSHVCKCKFKGMKGKKKKIFIFFTVTCLSDSPSGIHNCTHKWTWTVWIEEKKGITSQGISVGGCVCKEAEESVIRHRCIVADLAWGSVDLERERERERERDSQVLSLDESFTIGRMSVGRKVWPNDFLSLSLWSSCQCNWIGLSLVVT